MTIIVQRSGALGDVVLTTPVIRRLRRENPTTPIAVLTAYGDVFRHNPALSIPIPEVCPPEVRRIQLDLAYELQPAMHIVQAYMTEAFGDTGTPADLQQELFFPKRRLFDSGHRYVAVHAAQAGWRNRTLPRSVWKDVVEGLRKADLWPILVGTPRDDVAGCNVTRFFSADVLFQAQLIASCVAFVGSDSGLLHVAGATDTPIAAVMTCARPETRLPWRDGELGGKCIAVVPDLPCVGCLARRPPPTTTEYCERGDLACVKQVQAETIVEAVIAAIELFS